MNSSSSSDDDTVHRTFWRRVVEQNVVLPAVNLESLAVYCNERTLPPIDFNLIVYPRLITPTLCNINLEDENGSIVHEKSLSWGGKFHRAPREDTQEARHVLLRN